jgi:hypothetical protein
MVLECQKRLLLNIKRSIIDVKIFFLHTLKEKKHMQVTDKEDSVNASVKSMKTLDYLICINTRKT